MTRTRLTISSALVGVVLGVATVTAQSGAPAPQTPASPAAPSVPTVPQPPASAGPARSYVERVLVRVNGEIFTQSQLTSRQIEVLQDMKRDASAGKLEASLAEITPRLLVEAVDELLLVQRGREGGVKFSDEQFKTAIDNIKRDNKIDDAGLKAGLAQAGLTLDLLRERLERQYLVSAVQRMEIGPSLSITVEEMRQYYERNKTRFMTPTTVTLRELAVNVPSRTIGGKEVTSPADEADAKARIDGFRARAMAGAAFATIIAEGSDSATKANGGLIGPINVDDLNPALKDAVAKLQPGGLTEAFRGPRGFQVFQLETRVTPVQKPFDSVRADIESAIRDERIEPETQKLLERLRTQAVIEWKDDNFRKMYEQAIAASSAK